MTSASAADCIRAGTKVALAIIPLRAATASVT